MSIGKVDDAVVEVATRFEMESTALFDVEATRGERIFEENCQ
jgi:hypothetical protein